MPLSGPVECNGNGRTRDTPAPLTREWIAWHSVHGLPSVQVRHRYCQPVISHPCLVAFSGTIRHNARNRGLLLVFQFDHRRRAMIGAVGL
jgi:hypothetical protein